MRFFTAASNPIVEGLDWRQVGRDNRVLTCQAIFQMRTPRKLAWPLVGWVLAIAATNAAAEPEQWLVDLAAAVDGRQIVQLGENGHGVAEFYTVKTEIVAYLHEHHDFDILAVEGGVAECWLANHFLDDWTARQALQACFWDTWVGAESAALFEYLQSRRGSDRPLKLVGFDNQPTSQVFQEWLVTEPDDLTSKQAEQLLQAESAFTRLFSGRIEDPAEIAELHGQARDGFQAVELDHDILQLIIANRLASLDFDPAELSQETIGPMRDALMAELLLAQIEANPNARILVWAHNAHVAHAYSRHVGGYKRQGEFVHDRLGDRLYTLGIYSGGGRAYAWFLNEEVDLKDAQEGSLEARLLARSGPVVFADFNELRRAGESWVDEPTSAMEWGSWPHQIIPGEMFDGVLVVRTVAPLKRD
jgi:erythromycin esterase